MATDVLVHGAWAGGWGFIGMAERLRAAGHRVFVANLTGLGERLHSSIRALRSPRMLMT